MAKLHLVIANKNYSSWSLRAWLALRCMGIPFDETVIPLDTPQSAKAIRKHSKAGRLPVLHHGDGTIWESLAIIEYLAETFPDKPFWPRSRAARALARSVANEMHAGFQPLQNFYPMNLRRAKKPRPLSVPNDVQANIDRIQELWSECRKTLGKHGPFLFGRFSAADAMYAPVVTRFETYDVPVTGENRRYMNEVLKLKEFIAWKSEALKETWIIEADEVD